LSKVPQLSTIANTKKSGLLRRRGFTVYGLMYSEYCRIVTRPYGWVRIPGPGGHVVDLDLDWSKWSGRAPLIELEQRKNRQDCDWLIVGTKLACFNGGFQKIFRNPPTHPDAMLQVYIALGNIYTYVYTYVYSVRGTDLSFDSYDLIVREL
jgi:hypothetical protein